MHMLTYVLVCYAVVVCRIYVVVHYGDDESSDLLGTTAVSTLGTVSARAQCINGSCISHMKNTACVCMD